MQLVHTLQLYPVFRSPVGTIAADSLLRSSRKDERFSIPAVRRMRLRRVNKFISILRLWPVVAEGASSRGPSCLQQPETATPRARRRGTKTEPRQIDRGAGRIPTGHDTEGAAVDVGFVLSL